MCRILKSFCDSSMRRLELQPFYVQSLRENVVFLCCSSLFDVVFRIHVYILVTAWHLFGSEVFKSQLLCTL